MNDAATTRTGRRRPQERDARQWTFVVIPHDGTTRSYEMSYSALRVAASVAAFIGLLLVAVVVSWAWVAGQAARVPVLQREIVTLRGEARRVEQLSRMVTRLEAQYRQVRALLGTDAPRDALIAPLPAPPDSAATRGDSIRQAP